MAIYHAVTLGSGVVIVTPNSTPGADRILFYDQSSGKFEWLELGTNLSITGTTINATGGASELTDLTDVGVTTPTNRNALMADGDSWESRAIVEADISDLQSYLTAETNDLSAAVTWANVPNANITESSVTQHQAALSITESQISDLQSYLTSETSHADVLVDGDFASSGLMKTDGAGGYSIVADASTNWNTAYSWGDHSGLYDASGAADEAVLTHEFTFDHTQFVSDGDTLSTGLTFPNTGLHILDTVASYDLIVKPGSSLSADRTLTITTGDADRTLQIAGDATIQAGNFSGTNTGDQTITLTSDVTGSGTGSIICTIANNAVTYAKMQDTSGTDVLLGRSTAGAGDIEEITCTSFARTILDDADAGAVRTTLGISEDDTVRFAALNIGHAFDTTLARSGAGDLTVEGNAIYRAGGTDVPVSDGGTGASDAATARTNLGLGSVENTALSTWAGTTNITTLGTITSGTWNGTAIADGYIASAATWNGKMDDVVDDTTPQAGGDFDFNGHTAHFGTAENTQTPSGTTATIDLGAENHHTLDCGSASGDITLTLTVPPGPTAGTIIIEQDATARDITFSPSAGTVKWLGTEPTWNGDTSKWRIISWRWDGTYLFMTATETD